MLFVDGILPDGSYRDMISFSSAVWDERGGSGVRAVERKFNRREHTRRTRVISRYSTLGQSSFTWVLSH
jgi:hypothetical protein